MNWAQDFLNWFADQKIPMSERSAALGEFRYFQFSSVIAGVDGKKMYSFGSSPNREIAAVKCAAEAIERRFLDQFFCSTQDETLAASMRLALEFPVSSERSKAKLPPKGMRTSNGWAIHASAEQAIATASLEALERHLLLKSFYRWGWEGFCLTQEISNDEFRLFFMTSRFTSSGYMAGIVAAKSPHYPGVSFGYCIGKTETVAEASFWQPALLEATSRVQSLEGRKIELRENSNAWLQSDAKLYLESPFDLELFTLGKNLTTEVDTPISCFVKSFDLSNEWQLKFPLAAGYCWGGNLITLCNQKILDNDGKIVFQDLLLANNLNPTVPERSPIL